MRHFFPASFQQIQDKWLLVLVLLVVLLVVGGVGVVVVVDDLGLRMVFFNSLSLSLFHLDSFILLSLAPNDFVVDISISPFVFDHWDIYLSFGVSPFHITQ